MPFIGDVKSLVLFTMASVHLLHLEEKMKKLFAGFLATAAAALLSVGSASAQCKPQAGMPDYTGVTVTVGSQVGPFIASAMKQGGDSWSKATCGKVQIVEFPFGELYPKYLTAFAAGEDAFDVITFAPAWTPDLAPFLSEMPSKMRGTDAWQDIHPTYRDRLMVWEGKHKSQTIDGDLHTLHYRIDLFEDPKERAAFKAKYGRDLVVPRTWDEYYEVAEFFHRPSDGIYGVTEAFARGGQQFWFYFTHAASYTNHPENPGSMFFDPDTMDAQVNNPGWVKALEDYIKSLKLAPPGALNYSSGDTRQQFAGGKTSMNFDWGDTGTVGTDPSQSQIPGSVGSDLTPGSTTIWNYKTKQWDEFSRVIHSPFMAFGGWQAAVPELSEDKEAAWHYVEHTTNIENSSIQAITGGSGVNPYRYSHFSKDLWEKKMSPREANEYLTAQRDSLGATNVALDMRLPGYFSYTEILEIELTRALAGEISPQEALDSVASQWNELTDEFGRDAQKAAYRASMGL